jgi:hypothetical protein
MQQDRLIHLESVIARDQRLFFEIGKALFEIKEARLYRTALFENFNAYTKARWDMCRAHAYRLIQSYEIIKNLSPIGDILPVNESQVRPLVRLKPIEQREIWKNFLNSGTEITAQNLKKFIVTRKKLAGVNKPVDLTDQISKEYMSAVQTMIEQICIAQSDNWQKTSRQAGILWNRVVREKILSKGHENGHG